MLEWLAASLVILLALTVVFLPGLFSLAALGMRGLGLAAFAPVVSTAIAGVAAVVLGLLRIDWTVWSFTSVTALVIVGAWLIGRLLPRPNRSHRVSASNRWLLPTALAIGVVLGFWRIAAYISDPSAISQTNDAVFHLNALRFILESGSASSLDVSSFIGGTGFYPAAWHALASLVALTTGAELSLVANAMTIVIAAVVWPLGVTWFTRVITDSATVASYAAVLSGSLQAFPLLLFQWGVLYPNALSVALIPAAVGIVLTLKTWLTAERPWISAIRAGLLVGVAVVGLLLAQPAAALVFGLLCTIWFSWQTVTSGRRSVLTKIVLLAISWGALGAVWLYFSRSTGGSHWPPFRGKGEVWLDILFNGHLRIPFAWVISALMLVGLVVASRHALWRWLVIGWLAISALYVLVAAVGSPVVRNELLGAWYADPYRIAALSPIVVIPLAAIGSHWVVEKVSMFRGRRLARSTGRSLSSVVGVAVTTVLTVILILIRPVAMPAFLEGTFDAESRYLLDEDTYLSSDERALLKSLDGFVEEGARVIGNPSTGMAFGYMFSGVDVFPRTWSAPRTAEWETIASGLRDAAHEPVVCDAVAAYGNPEYVLDFGLGEDGPGRYEMPGMTNFQGQAGFELVTKVGDSSLWRIVACAY